LARDGEVIAVAFSGTAIRTDNGTVMGIVCVAQDIRERRRDQATGLDPVGPISNDASVKRDVMRARDKQVNTAQRIEAVGLLAGGVAHDFNNCLTVILSNAEFIAKALPPESQSYEDVQEISAAATNAERLTKQLLAFRRRQQVQTLEDIDLNRVIDDLGKMLRRVIKEDIKLVLRLGAVGLVSADESQIEQVLMNLAVNAGDAMPGGGTLVIETANLLLDGGELPGAAVPAGRYVTLTITDTGQGMDEQTQARAFDPFFTTKVDIERTGLGLSTVYGIVRQSHGFMWINTAPGTGTSIDIYLPEIEAVAAAEEPHSKSSRPVTPPS
jgi:signal transduction histidine kinase